MSHSSPHSPRFPAQPAIWPSPARRLTIGKSFLQWPF
jgi:hypothetical protein